MGGRSAQSSHPGLWRLVRAQHGVVTRRQLRELGLSRKAVEHRITVGRLHVVRRGVYAVGRPELSLYGHWMAAVLACGPKAVLSHQCAAGLWEIAPRRRDRIEVSVPAPLAPRPPGIVVHRRSVFGASDVTCRYGIPVTAPIRTLIDIGPSVGRRRLEAAINEADKHDLVDPEVLRSALEDLAPQPGVALLRQTLDRRTFTQTDSELERRFLPMARRAGLPPPETQRRLTGFRVDFFWPALGLVVETDGLRYHRTPAQQTRDRLRDQAHTAAGLTVLRFTRAQVVFDPRHVEATLAAVRRRLQAGRGTRSAG